MQRLYMVYAERYCVLLHVFARVGFIIVESFSIDLVLHVVGGIDQCMWKRFRVNGCFYKTRSNLKIPG